MPSFLENVFLHDGSRNTQNSVDLPNVFIEESKNELDTVTKRIMTNKTKNTKTKLLVGSLRRKENVPERFGTITGDWWENENIDCSLVILESNEPASIQEAFRGTKPCSGKRPLKVNTNPSFKTWKHGSMEASRCIS